MARPRTLSDAQVLERARTCLTEHGPGTSLARLARAIGLSPPALIKRFGSKEELLFRALLPTGPPAWTGRLLRPPGDDPVAELAAVLEDLARDFQQVGPALAALRMSNHAVDRVFEPTRPGPPIVARRLLARWLDHAGVTGAEPLADAAVGAAEARGFARWIGRQMVEGSDRDWALALARTVLRS